MIVKIKNQKSKIKKNERGFSLIELLVSIAVLVAIGSIVTNVITSSLRGSNKANNIENIRRNGNYALEQITKNIEYAQTFDGLSTDGSTYVANCPFSTPTPPASPSPVKTTYNYIKVTPLDSNPLVYECIPPVAPSTVPTFTVNDTVNEVDIIDPSSVNLTDCSISCTQTNATDVPIIGISFTLQQKNSNSLAENSSPPIKFETSITMRNYRR